ncbi:MAG: hypothetical protein ACXWCY_07330 [Burkholderiales bacterium]
MKIESQAYVDLALREKPEVFADITTIMKNFAQRRAPPKTGG